MTSMQSPAGQQAASSTLPHCQVTSILPRDQHIVTWPAYCHMTSLQSSAGQQVAGFTLPHCHMTSAQSQAGQQATGSTLPHCHVTSILSHNQCTVTSKSTSGWFYITSVTWPADSHMISVLSHDQRTVTSSPTSGWFCINLSRHQSPVGQQGMANLEDISNEACKINDHVHIKIQTQHDFSSKILQYIASA